MLIFLAGLPGVGKTSIARALAVRLGALHLRIDTIEQALRSSGALAGDIGPAGYAVAYKVAEDNLRLGRTVIVDSVNPLEITRAQWLAAAGRAAVPAVEVEIVCSDAAEHRRRVETRRSDIDGLVLPTWQAVEGRSYEGWNRPRLVVDTAAATIEQSIMAILARIGALPPLPAP